MPESDPLNLRYAEDLRHKGKLEEALKVIDEIEKKRTLSTEDKLSLLISKGKILNMYHRFEETVRVGKLAYRLSQSLGKKNEMIYSLLFKSSSLFLGQHDKALKYLFEAENILNSLSDISPSYITRQKKNILFRKSWAYEYKGDLKKALEEALECLELQEKFGSKSDIAYTLQLLGDISAAIGNHNSALDYASKSLTIFEELNDQIGKPASLVILGRIAIIKGNLNEAIKYHKQILSLKTLNILAEVESLRALGEIYDTRGELDKALKYYKKVVALAEKENIYEIFVRTQLDLGMLYLTKAEYDLAIDYLKLSLSLQEKRKNKYGIVSSLIWLGMTYLQLDDLEEAKKYLDRVEIQTEEVITRSDYLILKAVFLIKKGGSLNRGEAVTLLKQVVTNETYPYFTALSMVLLCEFYLEELKLFEDTEVLKELNPLVTQLYDISEEKRMYGNLAEAKLLQAKLALIQMDFEAAQRLLTEAQRVAELYGIKRLAQKISSEHDNYLEKLSEWKSLKEKDAPISERLNLASVEGVLERLQRKRTVEPPELVEEEPIVLLI
ncbi:MAG: tetratricopeptide repeat protein, partial [Promethearchaeota archaeon]